MVNFCFNTSAKRSTTKYQQTFGIGYNQFIAACLFRMSKEDKALHRGCGFPEGLKQYLDHYMSLLPGHIQEKKKGHSGGDAKTSSTARLSREKAEIGSFNDVEDEVGKRAPAECNPCQESLKTMKPIYNNMLDLLLIPSAASRSTAVPTLLSSFAGHC